MKISMIAAIGAKNELGEGNKLIWKIPSDLARFREKTSGHPIIMGRKTYESIGRLLPNRTNIVVTQNSKLKIQNCLIANSIEQAIDFARNVPGSDEVFIIGGAQIYTAALPFANKLYLTRINSEAPMADAFFPDYSDFKKVLFEEKHNDDGLEYEFLELER